jgi:hypothetical protein
MSMVHPHTETPIRAAVFQSVPEATRAVEKLLDAGFTVHQITVICSEETKQRYFREFEHQEPAGYYTPASAVAGGTLGALLGGAAAIAGTVATGGVALVAAGGLAVWSGAIVGSLVGAMMTRGFEHELANHYDQAVVDGKILVAAQVDHHPEMLRKAEQILTSEAAVAMPLREG